LQRARRAWTARALSYSYPLERVVSPGGDPATRLNFQWNILAAAKRSRRYDLLWCDRIPATPTTYAARI